jgi:hypothetical protein
MGVGFFFFPKFKIRVPLPFFVKHLQKRPEFHPCIEKIEEWKLLETPHILYQILRGHIGGNLFPNPIEYIYEQKISYIETLEELINSLTRFLARQIFIKEIEKAENEGKKLVGLLFVMTTIFLTKSYKKKQKYLLITIHG